jgi:hypothetical protein
MPRIHERLLDAREERLSTVEPPPDVGFGDGVTAVGDPVGHAGDRLVGQGEFDEWSDTR